ncbi:MAG: hypothetical protein ACT4PV_03820 [Planctomycetaceae bacterium]
MPSPWRRKTVDGEAIASTLDGAVERRHPALGKGTPTIGEEQRTAAARLGRRTNVLAVGGKHSGMAKRGEGAAAGAAGGEIRERQELALFERISSLARCAVRRWRLPPGDLPDLAQETYCRLLQRSGGLHLRYTDAAIRAVVASLAKDSRREQQRRTRARRKFVASGGRHAQATSVPVLCAALAELAALHRRPEEFLEALLLAARRVALEPGSLTDAQIRPFLLTYVHGYAPAQIRSLLRIATRKSLVHLIRRASRRVERSLSRRLLLTLDAGDAARLTRWLRLPDRPKKLIPQCGNVENSLTQDGLAYWDRLERALKALAAAN